MQSIDNWEQCLLVDTDVEEGIAFLLELPALALVEWESFPRASLVVGPLAWWDPPALALGPWPPPLALALVDLLEGPPLSVLLLQVVLLCPIPLQTLHLTTVPCLDSLPRLGFFFSPSCLCLSLFGLPGILTYFGGKGLTLFDTSQNPCLLQVGDSGHMSCCTPQQNSTWLHNPPQPWMLHRCKKLHEGRADQTTARPYMNMSFPPSWLKTYDPSMLLQNNSGHY